MQRPRLPGTALLAITILLLSPMSPLSAQAGAERELRVGGFGFDNFFQAPDGVAKEDVDALEALLRFSWASSKHPLRHRYLGAGMTSYSGLDQSPLLEAGLRHDGRPGSWQAAVETRFNRPTVDLDEGNDTSDLLHLSGRYGYRLHQDWEVSALADFYQQSFDTLTENDNDLVVVGGAVRYRGFGYGFSPEIGYAAGQRRADSSNQDYDQDEYWIKIRSAPTKRLYLSARYRFRDRRYPVSDLAASNFDRQDERGQWSLTASHDLFGSLTGILYYAYEDADSTLPSRVFTTSVLSLGLSTRF